VVFNAAEAIALLTRLGPNIAFGYGYCGSPASTAVTPYKRVAFTVFALHKPASEKTDATYPHIELNVPAELLAGLRPGEDPSIKA